MRKVLSFVLVLALVLGSFSFAFGLTDIEDSANKDAIQVCNDLGIIDGYPDGTFQGEKAVNRAEFAKMITVALGVPESALAGYATTSFKDVAGYSWAVKYLAFCESKGIMLGDGMGNAMPGRTISVNEAITMALRAIGYTENSAMLVGTWPSNYVTLGQQQGLYTDLATATTIDRENAAQVIYNALTVTLVTVNADGETQDVTNAAKDTMLEAYLNCEAEAKSILGTTFDYSNSLVNITGKLGAYGTPYTNSDGDMVAFKVETTSLTGHVNAAGTKFVVGDDEYEFSFNTVRVTTGVGITNTADAPAAGAIVAGTITTAQGAAADDDGEVTINVVLSGSKIKEVYSIVSWAADQALLADSDVQEDIADGELLTETFVLDDDDNIKSNSFELVGVDSLEDIAEDDVVYVFTDGRDIRKVMVGQDTVEGTVEEEYTAGAVDEDYVVIGGTKYYAALDTGATAVWNALPSLGDEVILYLDADGYVFDSEITSADPNLYAVVSAQYQAGGAYTDAKVKLFTSDGKESVYNFAESDMDDIDWVTPTGVNNGAAAVARMVTLAAVGYALDEDGDIEAVNVKYVGITAGTDKFGSSKVFYAGTNGMNIDSNAVVFTYDTTASAANWDVANLADVEVGVVLTNGGVGFDGYYLLNDEGTKIMAFFIHEDNVAADTDDTYGVVNTKTQVKDGTTTVNKLTGFMGADAFTYLTDKVGTFGDTAFGWKLYKFTVDTNDVITAATDVTAAVRPGTASGYIVTNGAITVSAVGYDNTVFTLATHSSIDSGAVKKITASTDAVVYEYDSADGVYVVSKLSAIKKDYTIRAYDTKGDDADGVATVIIFEK